MISRLLLDVAVYRWGIKCFEMSLYILKLLCTYKGSLLTQDATAQILLLLLAKHTSSYMLICLLVREKWSHTILEKTSAHSHNTAHLWLVTWYMHSFGRVNELTCVQHGGINMITNPDFTSICTGACVFIRCTFSHVNYSTHICEMSTYIQNKTKRTLYSHPIFHVNRAFTVC